MQILNMQNLKNCVEFSGTSKLVLQKASVQLLAETINLGRC